VPYFMLVSFPDESFSMAQDFESVNQSGRRNVIKKAIATRAARTIVQSFLASGLSTNALMTRTTTIKINMMYNIYLFPPPASPESYTGILYKKVNQKLRVRSMATAMKL
jgi:hypothetical protein